MIMKTKYFFILIVILTNSSLLTTCKADDNSMKILLYNNGEQSEIELNDEDKKQVRNILLELLSKTDDMLRVYFDEERINELQHTEKCIEINFGKIVKVQTGILGETNVKKILIPLSGDFRATETINIATILIGEDEYSSGPLTASGGFQYVKLLEDKLFNKK